MIDMAVWVTPRTASAVRRSHCQIDPGHRWSPCLLSSVIIGLTLAFEVVRFYKPVSIVGFGWHVWYHDVVGLCWTLGQGSYSPPFQLIILDAGTLSTASFLPALNIDHFHTGNKMKLFVHELLASSAQELSIHSDQRAAEVLSLSGLAIPLPRDKVEVALMSRSPWKFSYGYRSNKVVPSTNDLADLENYPLTYSKW